MLCLAQHITVRSVEETQLGAQDTFVISSLVDRLSREPSVSLNPHCLSQQTLDGLLDEIFAGGHGRVPSKIGTRKWLEEIGLLTPIAIDLYPNDSKPSTRFYRLDISRQSQSHPAPHELLQAYDKTGVICYFTALAFHSLTSQPAAHHHVAIPNEHRPKAKQTSLAKIREASPGERKKADPLGTWLFTFKGIRYYKTSREKRLLPGVQTRYTGPTSLIRITTLEQTLLDTLHRPLSCGGPAVVMEAWGQGLGRVNEDKIELFLREMRHLPTAQRLGYVLDNLEYKPGRTLKSTLESFLSQLNPNDPNAYQQLFPGVKYDHLRHPWLIYGPA
jgi:predicted transcriptional regulator of viral defense system